MPIVTQSLFNWMGGKARIADRILAELPPSSTYDTWCDPFCGSLIVSLLKHPAHHLEVANDRNEQLINFWMQVRDQAERLQWKLKTLPYAESLFDQYRFSLDSLNGNQEEGSSLDPVELACRWYYVKRCTIMGHIDHAKGWDYTGPKSKTSHGVPSGAVSYHNAVDMLQVISERLSRFQIHSSSYESIIKKYQSARTLFYIDPPYVGTEKYYTVDDTPLFTLDDHQRLSILLNETPAMVALSYYDCPELDTLYPRSRWRRQEWTTNKESSRINTLLQKSQEVLLMNYTSSEQSLWNV